MVALRTRKRSRHAPWDEVFEDVAARVEEASSEGPLGTTVAFLYVNEDGAAVTRRAGDYFCQMIEALLLGGALSLSGFLLQIFFANPIADPFVLGVSSGAKLVVAVVMIVVLGAGQVMSPAASVAGIMVGYICSAVTSFLVAFADDQSIVSLDNWSRGSFSGAACFRRLARDGVPFATGVLHEHDADGLLARSLASRAVCERDFEPVSERAVAEAREVLLGCRRVICCVSAFGTTNARNAELLDAAREAGIPVTSAPVPPHRVSRDCIQAM